MKSAAFKISRTFRRGLKATVAARLEVNRGL